LHDRLRLPEALLSAFDEKELRVARNGNCAEVLLDSFGDGLRPEVGAERGLVPGISPKLFGVRKEYFKERKGFGEGAVRHPVVSSSHPIQRALVRSLEDGVAERGQQIELDKWAHSPCVSATAGSRMSIAASPRNISSTPLPAFALVSKVAQPYC